ncbi:DUF411 domain-containing protein [Pseudomonas sp. R5(2019)]|uniref:DUF411 domain-containing protein n=1 Tax=Pseudomonas sp. R5(2019) TaxID=2697566 RepID=UPI001411F65F|nr:DUF411 domain-containing protein [Pseudomonas sp. R5(2019)]NBA93429.1 DUF411 domain-containing protein [Pseudomonas sp. R5(2019)]
MLKKSLLQRAALLALLSSSALAHAAEALSIDVYRDPNCGCCKEWIKHMSENGFTVHDHVEPNMSAVKERLGVAPRLASCHTGVINGKFVEGHVPAEQVKTLLGRSDLRGLAVPGMPMGSPGMEMGDHKEKYEVIGLTQAGKDEVVAQYPGH